MKNGVILGLKETNKPVLLDSYKSLSKDKNCFIMGKVGIGMSWSVKSNDLGIDTSAAELTIKSDEEDRLRGIGEFNRDKIFKDVDLSDNQNLPYHEDGHEQLSHIKSL